MKVYGTFLNFDCLIIILRDIVQNIDILKIWRIKSKIIRQMLKYKFNN